MHNSENCPRCDQSQDPATPSGETLRAAQGDGQSGLVGKELDAAIAERVMGFDEVEHIGDLLYYHNAEMDRLSETGGRWRSPVPMYHSDIAAAMEVESKIAERGLHREYAKALAKSCPLWSKGSDMLQLYWELAHATPEQRCRAALAAVVHNQNEEGKVTGRDL